MALLGPFQTIASVDWGGRWEIVEVFGFLNPEAAFVNQRLRFAVNFEDSKDCGGVNENRQFVQVRQNFKTTSGKTLVLNSIESSVGAANGSFVVDSYQMEIENSLGRATVAFGRAPIYPFVDDFVLCTREPAVQIIGTVPIVLSLAPGDNFIILTFDTHTGSNHRDAFFDFRFTLL
jgi:hypothetical protein